VSTGGAASRHVLLDICGRDSDLGIHLGHDLLVGWTPNT